jgi:hypothetical protein
MTNTVEESMMVAAMVVSAWLAGPMLALAAEEAKADEKKPRIEFEKIEHDFGTVKSDEHALHAFVFKNSGDATLTVHEVQSTCGCTVASWTKEPLAPGASGSVSVSVNPAKTSSVFAKMVYVKSNDPAQPQVTLTVRGKFISDVNWEPNANVIMGNVVGTAAATRTVTLSFEQPTKILEVLSNSEAFKTSYKELEAGKRYLIEVCTVPPLKLGGYGGIVTVKTDNPKHPMTTCNVNVNVVASITCYPPEVTYTRQGETWVGPTLLVRHNNGGTFSVLKAESSIQGVKLNVQPVVQGNSYRLVLDKPAADSPTGDGEVAVYTDNKEVPVLRVPLHLR